MSGQRGKSISDEILAYKLYCYLFKGKYSIPNTNGEKFGGQIHLEMGAEIDIPDETIEKMADELWACEPRIRSHPENLELLDLSGKNTGPFSLRYVDMHENYVFGISLSENYEMSLRLRYNDLLKMFPSQPDLDKEIEAIYDTMQDAVESGKTWSDVDKDWKFSKHYLDVISEFFRRAHAAHYDIPVELLKYLSGGLDYYIASCKKERYRDLNSKNKQYSFSVSGCNFSGKLGQSNYLRKQQRFKLNGYPFLIDWISDTAFSAHFAFRSPFLMEVRALKAGKKVTAKSLCMGITFKNLNSLFMEIPR